MPRWQSGTSMALPVSYLFDVRRVLAEADSHAMRKEAALTREAEDLRERLEDAIDNMDQSELFGRVIKVSAAKPPKNANEGLGSKTALWEQVCLSI